MPANNGPSRDILQSDLTIQRGRPKMTAMTRLGRRIQTRRTELGLTLAVLSERSGVLPQTINAIERGVSRQPRIDTLSRLADALQLDRYELAADAFNVEPVPA